MRGKIFYCGGIRKLILRAERLKVKGSVIESNFSKQRTVRFLALVSIALTIIRRLRINSVFPLTF